MLFRSSLSLDDFIVAQFTAGPLVTLPLYLAGAVQREISPQIHVLATVVLVLSVGVLALTSGVVGPVGRPRSDKETLTGPPRQSQA